MAWLLVRAGREDLEAIVGALPGDVGAAAAAAVGAIGPEPAGVGRASDRARRRAWAELMDRYPQEWEELYAEALQNDRGPTGPGPTVGATPSKVGRGDAAVEANNRRNRARGRAKTRLAANHRSEFRRLYDAALAVDDGPAEPYEFRRLRSVARTGSPGV